jgi:Carbohydrate binding domain
LRHSPTPDPSEAPPPRGGSRGRLALLVSGALVVSGVATVSVLSTAAGAATVNLLTNPSFGTGNLTGWTCDAGTATVVTSPVYTGESHALSATPTSSDDAQCTQAVAVLPNTSYTLSGYVEGAYAYVGVTGGSDDWTPSTTSWQQLTTTFTTTTSQTSVQVYVHGWYAEGTYYADDLDLSGPAGSSPSASATTPTPPPTSSSPTPTPTPT